MSVEGVRMRIFLFAVSASLAFTGPAGAASRNFGITGFSKIRVDGPFKVTLATGIPPFAKATGSSQDALDRVAIDVRGDTLVVHSSQSSWGGYPGKDVGPVEISLGTHELSAAWLNGAGSLSIDRVKGLAFGLSVQGSGGVEIGNVAVDQFNVGLIGSANARLGGQTKKLTAIVRGISTLDAARLQSDDATIGAEGAATIDAIVRDEANVSSSGNATIRLAGRPSCTLKMVGSTSVSGCR
jgi:hypothetical protein